MSYDLINVNKKHYKLSECSKKKKKKRSMYKALSKVYNLFIP